MAETSHPADLAAFRQTRVYTLNEAALIKTISIHPNRWPRRHVLEHIVHLGGLRIAFDPDLDALGEPVSLRLKGATVLEALQEAVRGSDLLLSLSPRGLLMVRRSPYVTPPAKKPTWKWWEVAGGVTGIVTDAQTGEPLPGATVRVEGTSLGAATDIEGNYRIVGVPAGAQTLVGSYVGYESEEALITVVEGETVEQDFALSLGLVEGEEIVVTAQFEGQARAINQQINSEQIVNVVSSDRIREVPDANAAEAVGRLPGVAIQRNAGEGQKVLIRGLSPRYANITVNGEKIPATSGDRSVDLSMVSQDVLAGIELYKALTPDQDADAIGGTVNFVIRRAPRGLQGRLDLQTGYNSLAEELGQYRFSATASNRFLGDKLGVLLTGSAQRANRGSDQFDVNYRTVGEETEGLAIGVDDLTLIDQAETRDRYSGSAALDYDLGGGSDIRLNTFFGQTTRDRTTRSKRYAPAVDRVNYGLNDQELETYLWTNALSGHHLLGRFEVDWKLAQASTVDRMPFSTGIGFEENAPFTGELVLTRGPFPIPEAAKNDLSRTVFQGGGDLNTSRSVERDLTTSLDVKLPFALGSGLTGYLKAGGKYRDKLRRQRSDAFVRAIGANFLLIRDNPGKYETYNNQILVSEFFDEGYDPGEFLGGRFDFNALIDADAARDIYETYEDSLARPSRYSELGDYDAGEAVSAGYFMARINLGRRIMLLPGFRYEHTSSDYEAKFTDDITGPFGERGEIIDTTGSQSYGEFLPMVHLRASFLEGLDLRLAVTRTLARPVYSSLSPGGRINYVGRSINRGNPDLEHTTAWNYDAILSFYSGQLGLVSVGGFYKRLRNIDYNFNTKVINPESELFGYDLSEPRNANESTSVYGVETELQTNLRFLPSPLDGIVLNLNYTRTFGETYFPILNTEVGGPPFYRSTFVEGERAGPLPGQADHIANASFGYEKGGFSGRVSVIYQAGFLTGVGKTAELDSYDDDFLRWDATLTQRVIAGATVYFSVNNFTGLTERSLLGRNAVFIEDEEDYGWTADLGFRYNF